MSLSGHHTKAKRHFFIYAFKQKRLISCGGPRTRTMGQGKKPFFALLSLKRFLLGHAADCRPTLAVCANGLFLRALLESLAKHSTDRVRLENSSLTASRKSPIIRTPKCQIYNLTPDDHSLSLMTWPPPTPLQECSFTLWLSSLLSRQQRWESLSADTLETKNRPYVNLYSVKRR